MFFIFGAEKQDNIAFPGFYVICSTIRASTYYYDH